MLPQGLNYSVNHVPFSEFDSLFRVSIQGYTLGICVTPTSSHYAYILQDGVPIFSMAWERYCDACDSLLSALDAQKESVLAEISALRSVFEGLGSLERSVVWTKETTLVDVAERYNGYRLDVVGYTVEIVHYFERFTWLIRKGPSVIETDDHYCLPGAMRDAFCSLLLLADYTPTVTQTLLDSEYLFDRPQCWVRFVAAE